MSHVDSLQGQSGRLASNDLRCDEYELKELLRGMELAPVSSQYQLATAGRSLHITSHLDRLKEYHDLGINIFPCQVYKKHPNYRYAGLKSGLPESFEDLKRLYEIYPGGNIAAALGPVSDLVVIDVDGKDALDVLIQHTGPRFTCPASKSGSPNPYKCHLFFRHPPGLQTRATMAPWHPQLEFRGDGGLIVLPPSTHPSGLLYRWLPGCSIFERNLSPLPTAIADAITNHLRPRPVAVSTSIGMAPSPGHPVHGLRKATRDFLNGNYRHEYGGRNNILFRAACDLAEHGVPQQVAIDRLMPGFGPRNVAERGEVISTVKSAYNHVSD